MDRMLAQHKKAALVVLTAAFAALISFIGFASPVSASAAYLTDNAEARSTIKIADIKREAFAVYSADDGSFNFYKRATVPETGDIFEGRTVTNMFRDIETRRPAYNTPWGTSVTKSVLSATVVDEISPVSCSYWFAFMPKCTQIDLTKLDTSKVESMDRMFYQCGSVAELDLSRFDTSKVQNMSEMFYDCRNLTRVGSLAGWDVSNVTTMYRLFSKCYKLEEIDVSAWRTSSCTNMVETFNECQSVKALDVSSFDVSKVPSFLHTFAWCKSMTTLNGLSSWDTSSCTNMYGMFEYCEELRAADVSHFNTSNVTSIAWMFSWNRSISELDLSNFDTGNVADSSYMFNASLGLKRVSFGDAWTLALSSCNLAMPNSKYVEGADGKWHNEATGEAYSSAADMPVRMAVVYVAVPPDNAKAIDAAEEELDQIIEDQLEEDATEAESAIGENSSDEQPENDAVDEAPDSTEDPGINSPLDQVSEPPETDSSNPDSAPSEPSEPESADNGTDHGIPNAEQDSML